MRGFILPDTEPSDFEGEEGEADEGDAGFEGEEA
jgi:hypothetical protein